MSVNVIDVIKPKNGGSFPVAEDVDIKMSDGSRLSAAIENKANKSELNNKADKSNTYTKSEVDNKIASAKVDAYTKSESDEKYAEKSDLANKADVSTVSELQSEVENKADKSDVSELQSVISTKADKATTDDIQNQIDNFDHTPEVDEVVNARNSSSGASYPTLKARLDGENSSVKEDLNFIQQSLDNIGNNPNLISNYYNGGFGGASKGTYASEITINEYNTRLRTINDTSSVRNFIPVPANRRVTIKANDGYEYAYQAYSGKTGISLLDFSFLSGETKISFDEDVYIAILIKRTDDNAILISEAQNVKMFYSNGIEEELNKKLDFTKAQKLSDSEKETAKNNIGVSEELRIVNAKFDEITFSSGFSLSENDFEWGLINPNGSTEIIRNTPLNNIFSRIVNADGITIIPKSVESIFKVAYYKANGEFIEQTPWMGKGAFTIVDSYTINGEYCRIAIADATSSVGTERISEHLERYFFSGSTKTVIKEEALPDNTPITLPFNMPLDFQIFKKHNEYVSVIHDTHIKTTNGVPVYISPNGNHDADGLTVLSPVKTIDEAMSIENVETVIFLEGEYLIDVNYSRNNHVRKPVNFIACGNVVFNNIADYAPIVFEKSAYVEGIHFKHGANTVIAALDSSSVVTFKNCVFSESDSLNGLSILGGKSYIINCKAFGNAFDGLNYHANEGIINYSIESGCISYGNGTKRLDYDDGQSSNATTSHDGSYIVRVNGNYYACHGGVVADKECSSANYGCKSGVSTVTDNNYPDRKSNYWSSAAHMYLYDCISYGSKYDTAKINGGTIISNIEYASNY